MTIGQQYRAKLRARGSPGDDLLNNWTRECLSPPKHKARSKHAAPEPIIETRKIGDGYFVSEIQFNGSVVRGLADNSHEAVLRAKSLARGYSTALKNSQL